MRLGSEKGTRRGEEDRWAEWYFTGMIDSVPDLLIWGGEEKRSDSLLYKMCDSPKLLKT